MEKLSELIKVLHPKRVTYVDIFSHNLPDDSKLRQLYDGIKSGKITDDASGIRLLYDQDPSGKSKFAKLKSYFKKRLLNTALLADAKHGKRMKAFFECMRAFVSSYFLIMLQGRASAIQLLRNKLKVMQRFEFTFLTLETAKILRQHYSTRVGDFKRAQFYDDLIESYLSVYVIETRVEGHYHKLMNYYVRNRVSSESITQLCDECVQKIPKRLPTNASTNLIFKWHTLIIIQQINKRDFEKAKLYCEKAVEWLSSKDFVDRTALIAIYFQWVSCSLNTGDVKTAERLMKEIMPVLRIGEFNWFKAMLIAVDISLASKSYQQAFEHYKIAVQHKNFNRINVASKEEWKIYGAYIYLLSIFGKISINESSPQQPLDPNKVLNEISIYARDKKGLNVTIIIYSIILLIHQHNYDKVVENYDGFSKYIGRYLMDQKHERSVAFIKMLLYVCKMKYSNVQMMPKIQAYRRKLIASTKNSDRSSYDLEIISYEELWRMLDNHLQSKKWYKSEG